MLGQDNQHADGSRGEYGEACLLVLAEYVAVELCDRLDKTCISLSPTRCVAKRHRPVLEQPQCSHSAHCIGGGLWTAGWLTMMMHSAVTQAKT